MRRINLLWNCRSFFHAAFKFIPEFFDNTLHRPCRRVAQRADGVAFDLLGDFQQHVDLALVGATLDHAAQHAPHPAGALAARRALAAALVLVEVAGPRDGLHQVGVLVEHDHGAGAQARAPRLQVLIGHHGLFALLRRDHAHRDAAGDDGLEVLPAATHAAELVLDQLLDADPDRVLDRKSTRLNSSHRT